MIKRSSQTIVATTKPIFKAIEQDDLDRVKRLVQENKQLLNEPNEEGKSPLHVASALGHTDIVIFLLEAGAEVNFSNKFDRRGSFRRVPLHDAAKGGHAAVVSCLAKRNAQLNVKDGQGETALHLAAGFIHLLPKDEKDESNIENLRQTNEAHYLAVVKALCDEGVDLDLTNQRDPNQILGRTALHLSIFRGHRLIALELIKRGARIDTQDCDGYSPYLSAYLLGMDDVCEAIIQRLKEEDQQQLNTDSSLERLELDLIDEEEDQQQPRTDSYFERLGLDFVDEDGNTVLHALAMKGDDELVSRLCTLLRTFGANCNPQDKDHKTPLFLAACGGHAKTVKTLLDADADPRIKIRYSEKTALDKARKKGHHECVTLIEAWLEAHPDDDAALSTEPDDEPKEISVQPAPDQSIPVVESPITEATQVDNASLTSTLSLLAHFIEENSAMKAAVKAFFEALQSPLPEEVKEFISRCVKDPEADICTLSTLSGKNVLHLIAEHDPQGTLLGVLKNLTDSQISTLLSQKSLAGKYPFHCASEQGHSTLMDYCLRQMLQSKEGTSRFRDSLHGDGDFIEWLLGLKHFPKKIPILFDVMADLHAEISTRQATLENTASNKPGFFPVVHVAVVSVNQQAQLSTKASLLRKRLLYRIFHQFDWPDELIEAVSKLIGTSERSRADPTKEKSKEHQLLDFLISDGMPCTQTSSLHHHALVILTLACQSLENNPEKSKFPGRVKLETQFFEQFQKHSEEMLKRVKALYDYLCTISPDLASSFLKKIVKSESLLKFSLQKVLASEGWWNVEIPEQFEETLLIQFKQSEPSAFY